MLPQLGSAAATLRRQRCRRRLNLPGCSKRLHLHLRLQPLRQLIRLLGLGCQKQCLKAWWPPLLLLQTSTSTSTNANIKATQRHGISLAGEVLLEVLRQLQLFQRPITTGPHRLHHPSSNSSSSRHPCRSNHGSQNNHDR